MAGGAVFFIALGLLCKILQPNVVRVLNLWETAVYFIGAWVIRLFSFLISKVYLSAVLVHYSKSTMLATVVLLLGILAILIITLVIHKYRKMDQDQVEPQSDPKEDKGTLSREQTKLLQESRKIEVIPEDEENHEEDVNSNDLNNSRIPIVKPNTERESLVE